MVIQPPAPLMPVAPAATSVGKKIIIFIIFILVLGIGAVYANLNGYIDLPFSITKFIPPQYLPVADIAETVKEAYKEEPETYEEEPETYEDEMAKYEKESYRDETETYEEEKYVEHGAPEAYTS